MGHLSALANGNDEEDAVISDLEHRDDGEPATQSEPTAFEKRYEKSQWGKVTVGKSHSEERQSREKPQWGKATHPPPRRKRFLTSSGPGSSSGSKGPSGRPDSIVQLRCWTTFLPWQQEGCPEHILQQRLQVPLPELWQLRPLWSLVSREYLGSLSSDSAGSALHLGNGEEIWQRFECSEMDLNINLIFLRQLFTLYLYTLHVWKDKCEYLQ